MAAKKAAKKVVTKVAAKKVAKAARKLVNGADPFYVVLERGFLSAKARSLHTTREAATTRANELETASNAAYNKFTVQRVDLAE